jgi:Protein of unknown function (DUF3810)
MARPRLLTAAAQIVIVALAAVVAVAPLPPEAVERYYSNSVFPAIQRVVTQASNLTAYALVDGLIVIGLIGLVAITLRRSAGARSRWVAALLWLARLTVAAALLVLVFYLAWGLNYRRVPLIRKIPFDAQAISAEAAKALALRTVGEINTLYPAAHTYASTTVDVDPSLSAGFAEAQRAVGVVHPATPGRPKNSILDWYFKAAGVSGMTDPIFLETLVVSDLIPFERSHVIAHEWSHLAGFVDEGEANFVGWLSCMKASPAARYSGWMFLYTELVSALNDADRKEVTSRLDFGPRADLLSAAERIRRDVKPVIANAGWMVYDRYLKANRVEAGRASYAQVVRIILGVRHDPDLFPQAP